MQQLSVFLTFFIALTVMGIGLLVSFRVAPGIGSLTDERFFSFGSVPHSLD